MQGSDLGSFYKAKPHSSCTICLFGPYFRRLRSLIVPYSIKKWVSFWSLFQSQLPVFACRQFQQTKTALIHVDHIVPARAEYYPEPARSAIYAIFWLIARIFTYCDKSTVFNVLQQKVILTFCDKTMLAHAKDVRSGQPLFCNQPPRGSENEPE